MSYRYFRNDSCDYYPCHRIADINCLFCFCPLYHLDCGGNCTFTESGKKDCKDCLLPHGPDGYRYVIEKLEGMNRKESCE